MSLDFYLLDDEDYVFSRNITHNLSTMADAAGIYKVLWRPDENGFILGKDCIQPLSAGLLELVCHKKKFEKFNSPNGWGMYEHFVPFVTEVLSACSEFPEAIVRVSR